MPPVSEADLHHGIARDIGQQVERMILEAKHNNEQKVGKEIQRVKAKMEQIGEKIKLVNDRITALDSGSHGMLKADLLKSVQKLEDVWEGEVGTLKHELWQTIQAHNHNSDLLKHHKDAIDQVQTRMQEHVPSPELESVHAQLMQAEGICQREQAKEQQMDQLMQRLTVVQQQLFGMWPTAGLGAGLPGMPGFANMPQAQAKGQAAAKKAQGKAPAGKAKANGKKAAKAHPGGVGGAGAASMNAATLNAASLRAEAPEFVPTQTG
jgi:uncharacterized protein YukE